MEIHDEHVGDTWIVTAKGRLDGNASANFADHVGRLIESANPKLLIDFTGVDFVSSAGVWPCFYSAKRSNPPAGRSLSAACATQCGRYSISPTSHLCSAFIPRAEAIAAMGK